MYLLIRLGGLVLYQQAGHHQVSIILYTRHISRTLGSRLKGAAESSTCTYACAALIFDLPTGQPCAMYYSSADEAESHMCNKFMGKGLVLSQSA
jgi:hypothetical protein